MNSWISRCSISCAVIVPLLLPGRPGRGRETICAILVVCPQSVQGFPGEALPGRSKCKTIFFLLRRELRRDRAVSARRFLLEKWIPSNSGYQVTADHRWIPSNSGPLEYAGEMARVYQRYIPSIWLERTTEVYYGTGSRIPQMDTKYLAGADH